MHPLLERQLKKCFGKTEGFDDAMGQFVDAVEAAYAQGEEDRMMLERSMELSSKELLERNNELTAAEKKYRTIFESATEGIFQTSPEGRFISANPALARIYGYNDPDELIQSVTDIASQIYVDPSARESIRLVIEKHGAIPQHESMARRKDGTLIWIAETTRAVRDRSGNLTHYEGTVHDISLRKEAEIERQQLQSRLMEMSRQSGMSEVATGVLHNVGNVLNSINISASLAVKSVQGSKLQGLSKATQLMTQHRDNIAAFIAEDEKGKHLPEYIIQLTDHLVTEQEGLLGELTSLSENLEHVKRIVTMQQQYAKVSGVSETFNIEDLVEDTIRLSETSFSQYRIELVREYKKVPPVCCDKHHVMQILTNLISNARHAMRDSTSERKITLRIGPSPNGNDRYIIEVRDTGIGIPEENLTRIFNHGFTTKPDGHGFGLHSAALAAESLGGKLTAYSDGLNTGATFTLDLPIIAPDFAELKTSPSAA